MSEQSNSPSDRLELIEARLREDGEDLAGSSSHDRLNKAIAYWKLWPNWLSAINSWGNRCVDDSVNVHAIRQSLVFANGAATDYLMRQAERLSIDSSDLASSKQVVASVIMATAHAARPGNREGSVSSLWPEYLGQTLYELPEGMQQAIGRSSDAFSRLIAKLELDNDRVVPTLKLVSIGEIVKLLREKGIRRDRSTVEKWTTKPNFPEPVTADRPRKWAIEAVNAWLLSEKGFTI